MGGGSHKDHQSFTVTPSATLDAGPADTDPVDTEPLDEAQSVAHGDAAQLDTLAAQLPAPGAADRQPKHPMDASQLPADPTAAGPDEDASAHAAADGLGDHGNEGAPARIGHEDVLTPVPDELIAGDVAGGPLLVGGADLVDSTATLIAYDSPGGPREVLVGTVDEAAEAKLLESLALSETKMIPVAVETEVHGRLPVDSEHQLFEQLAKAAKSTNHHLKAGDEVPAHTTETVSKVKADLAELAAGDPSDTDQAMVVHYQAAVDGLEERTAPGYDVAYGQGGKMPTVTAFEMTGTATVTNYVPAPATALAPGLLPTAARDATRLDPTLTAEGTVSWNGTARSEAKGKEYVADLGDGYSAVYRPYGANDPASSEYSMRGALEVIAPQGAGHSAELVDRLGQLNLVNRPMTGTEGEWTYLNRNIWAQRLDGHPAVKSAMADADGLEDAVEHVIFAQRAHEAIGMSEAALHRFAKQIRLDAEAKALPEKVKIVRDGVAAAAGYPDGSALAASAGYQPAPRQTRAGLSWGRFDVTGAPDKVRAAFAKRGLTHHVTGGNMADLFRSGMLASTERRALMGVKKGKGMSEGADKMSGGASSVFLRAGTRPTAGPSLYWDDPTTILGRADWYAYSGDHFGVVNPKDHHSMSGQTRDPMKLASFKTCGNEVMVRHGLDLLGTEAPSLIRCSSTAQRNEVLAVLAAKNVTHLAGRPVDQVVK